jgi:hypothetical protein
MTDWQVPYGNGKYLCFSDYDNRKHLNLQNAPMKCLVTREKYGGSKPFAYYHSNKIKDYALSPSDPIITDFAFRHTVSA